MSRAKWLLGLVVALLVVHPPRAGAVQGGIHGAVTVQSRSALARADSLLKVGDQAGAERGYRAVLATDTLNSRATYQLGVLHRDRPRQALQYFVRYVRLEPDDPWGPLAVAEVSADLKQGRAALRWHRRAAELAPGEPAIVLEYARALGRLGHTEAAIRVYRRWLDSHPGDAAAESSLARELLRAGRPRQALRAIEHSGSAAEPELADRAARAVRLAAAPRFESVAGGTTDSEGNAGRILSLQADVGVGSGARAGARVGLYNIRAGVDDLGTASVSAIASWRPVAHARFEANIGAQRIPITVPVSQAPPASQGPNGPPASQSPNAAPASHEWIAPTGRARLRLAEPGGGVLADLSFQRDLLAATPVLVQNRVIRQEARLTLEVPVAGRLRFRGQGRFATIDDLFEQNQRGLASAAAVVRVSNAVELSIQASQAGFRKPSYSGYFAPWSIQTVQLGTYAETERGTWSLAADVSAGVQRIADHGAPYAGWRQALGFYGMASWTPVYRMSFRLELELYDSAVAPAAVTVGGAWRYGSLNLGVAWTP